MFNNAGSRDVAPDVLKSTDGTYEMSSSPPGSGSVAPDVLGPTEENFEMLSSPPVQPVIAATSPSPPPQVSSTTPPGPSTGLKVTTRGSTPMVSSSVTVGPVTSPAASGAPERGSYQVEGRPQRNRRRPDFLVVGDPDHARFNHVKK